jgi:hypothetical protein
MWSPEIILHGTEGEEVTQSGSIDLVVCFRTTINFLAKNKTALCMRVHCHGVGSTCWETILASCKKPTASDISKFVDVTSGWLSYQVGQMLHLTAVRKANQHCLDFWFWRPCFLRMVWIWRSTLNTMLHYPRDIQRNPTSIHNNDFSAICHSP